MRWSLSIAIVVVLGCSGGGRTQIAIGPPPAKQTRGELAGPLCKDGQCSCRTGPGDGGAGVAAPGRKRFEIRLGPSAYELWLSMPGGTVLYKSLERADACFYVDLPPGEHPVELRASNPTGVSVGLAIHEFGAAARSWYDTFKFACGSPGVCSFEELEDNKASYVAVKRGLHDPCGSTRVKQVTWDHGKAPDQLHPSELVVRLTLHVYKFAPERPSGDSCEGRLPRDEDGDPGAPESATPAGP